MTETDPQAIEAYNAALAHVRAGRLGDACTAYERAIALTTEPAVRRLLEDRLRSLT